MSLTKVTEEMLTDDVVSKLNIPRYLAFYNGSHASGASYVGGLGTASGNSIKTLGRIEQFYPSTLNVDTYKDSVNMGCPCPIIVGDEIYVYYEGYDGTHASIFRLTTSLDGGLREKPIEPVLLYSAIASTSSIARPAVIYDPTDVSAPFKMIFNRAATATNYTFLTAATSLDGVNWTVLGDIMTISTGWESTYLETTGRLVKDGATYRIFYSGHNGTYWQSGEAHTNSFTAAGWVKNTNNPLLVPRGGYKQAITVDIAAGTKTVKVANSALFDVGAPITVWNDSAGTPPGDSQYNIISAIPDATTLTMKYTWQGGYGVSLPSYISQVHSRSVELCDVVLENGVWKAVLTCFQFGQSTTINETTGYAETSNLNSGFTILPTIWPLPLNNKLSTWDRNSAENLKYVQVA